MCQVKVLSPRGAHCSPANNSMQPGHAGLRIYDTFEGTHTFFFPKESNRPETCNNSEVEVKFWWVGKWVGLLRKRNAFWESISGMMNQDLLNSCVIMSKLLSRPKILFLYLKSGYNIGNVYFRVIVKTK